MFLFVLLSPDAGHSKVERQDRYIPGIIDIIPATLEPIICLPRIFPPELFAWLTGTW